MKKKQVLYFFIPIFIVISIILGIILFPKQSIISAKNGFKIWYDILIPSLLPFIIGANLIVELKVMDIIGYIVNPITRLIFNVSGKSALIFAISTISGYPVGTKLASEFRNRNEISKYEAQRLVSFCSTSGPLFIIGSVATGMFKNTPLGYLIIFCHYLGAISVGILFRNYGPKSSYKKEGSLKSSIDLAINSRASDNNGFFVLFGNAIYSGVNTLLIIGGFVIVFSVIFEILSLFNVIEFISSILFIPLSLFGVSKELSFAFVSGLFEMTIGCSNVSSVVSSPEIIRASLVSFLIAFSGLSILAQCSSFLATTDINVKFYILAKFLHGIFASIFTVLLYPLLESTSLVSSFNNTYQNFYNNFVLNFYIFNFDILFPLFIIIYIFITLVILDKKLKKES